MTGDPTLKLTPGITKTHLPDLIIEDNEVSIEDEISITLKMTIKQPLGLSKLQSPPSPTPGSGCPAGGGGGDWRTNIDFAPVQIVVRGITLSLTVDLITKLNAIIVMCMVIKPDYVPIMHSNQRITY